jgi:four helix bundle protein
MQDYKKLKIWQQGHEITLLTYTITKTFPKDEMYGLTSQMRRAAFSIPANIAEGCGRDSQAELGRFVTIASGSAFELDYLAHLAIDLGYLSSEQYTHFYTGIDELRRMLNGFIKKLKTKI